MNSPKEDYEIRKRVESDPGTREDLLNFLFFYTLFMYYLFTTRSNKCTSKFLSVVNTIIQSKKFTSKLLLAVNT